MLQSNNSRREARREVTRANTRSPPGIQNVDFVNKLYIPDVVFEALRNQPAGQPGGQPISQPANYEL